jgi:predicted MFS family arabinose efflux permease
MNSDLAGSGRRPAQRVLDQTSLVLAALVGEYSLLVMPFILGAMMDAARLSEVSAGRLVSLQLLAMAIASIGVSTRLRAGQSVRPLLLGGISAICLANTLCALASHLPILAAARALTGLGEGTVMAAAAAAVCATADPHRLFSLIGAALAVVASVALAAAPWLAAHAGSGSIFWLLALVPLTLLPLLRHIPLLARASETQIGAPPEDIRLSAGMLLISFLLLWSGASGLWVYAERIGGYQGLTPAEVGVCLGIGQLAGIPGPLVAAWGGPRFGARRSLVAGCAGMTVAAVLFVFGGSRWLYGAGASLASFSIMFVVPCFRSRMASLDVSGRTVAASSAFYTVGFGAAPLVVSTITTEGRSYAPVAVFCCACFLLSAALAAGARRKIRAATASVSGEPSGIAD